jgi:hypothetical protein
MPDFYEQEQQSGTAISARGKFSSRQRCTCIHSGLSSLAGAFRLRRVIIAPVWLISRPTPRACCIAHTGMATRFAYCAATNRMQRRRRWSESQSRTTLCNGGLFSMLLSHSANPTQPPGHITTRGLCLLSGVHSKNRAHTPILVRCPPRDAVRGSRTFAAFSARRRPVTIFRCGRGTLARRT